VPYAPTEAELNTFKELTGTVPDFRGMRALNEETLVRLLRAGAKVSEMDKDWRTPLHVAARFDNGIRPTYAAGGLVHDFANDQAAIARRAAFQFHGSRSAMRLAG
jgi:ankyrin repeat protein